jgi:hypothetical protein
MREDLPTPEEIVDILKNTIFAMVPRKRGLCCTADILSSGLAGVRRYPIRPSG